MRIVEEFFAQGHPNIVATHATTFEITRDTELTHRGDCVIGVNASIGPRDLSKDFKNLCRKDASRIIVELDAAGFSDFIEGSGSSRLEFRHSSEFVGRKSTYVSDRTIMIKADKAARDLNRELIDALKSSTTRLCVRMIAEA